MRKLVMGCAVAGLIALSARTEARLPASIAQLPLETTYEKQSVQYGLASWYGEEFQGLNTASGEVYDLNGLTAAHRELPLGTRVRVTNLRNQRSVVLRVNDRGPLVGSRVIDVSYNAALHLGFVQRGLTPVRIDVLTYPKCYVYNSTIAANQMPSGF